MIFLTESLRGRAGVVNATLSVISTAWLICTGMDWRKREIISSAELMNGQPFVDDSKVYNFDGSLVDALRSAFTLNGEIKGGDAGPFRQCRGFLRHQFRIMLGEVEKLEEERHRLLALLLLARLAEMDGAAEVSATGETAAIATAFDAALTRNLMGGGPPDNRVGAPVDFTACAKNWTRQLKGYGHPHHPVPAFAISMLKGRVTGRAKPEGFRPAKLYFSIREARGGGASRKPDRGIVVRDLLWSRPVPVGGRPGRSRRVAEALGPLAIYMSAMDQSAFKVNQHTRGTEWQIYVGERHIDQNLPFLLSHADFKDGDLYRIGLLQGTTRSTSQPCAWKVILADCDCSANLLKRLEMIGGIEGDEFLRFRSDWEEPDHAGYEAVRGRPGQRAPSTPFPETRAAMEFADIPKTCYAALYSFVVDIGQVRVIHWPNSGDAKLENPRLHNLVRAATRPIGEKALAARTSQMIKAAAAAYYQKCDGQALPDTLATAMHQLVEKCFAELSEPFLAADAYDLDKHRRIHPLKADDIKELCQLEGLPYSRAEGKKAIAEKAITGE